MLSLAFPAIDPIAIAIGPIAIRWYALAYIAGLLLGWRYVVHYCSKTPNIMSKRDIDDLLFWATLGVILGGRTGYVLFYNLDYYLANPANILKVWQGGMAFHGGFMGVIIAIILFARKRGISILAVLDAAAVAAPIGLFFGRIANFINGELFGRATDAPWGVISPGEHGHDCGQPLGEFCARHPSQLYEAGLEGLALGLIILVLVLRGALKFPGLVAGTFFAGYGTARFFVEFFRQPDMQFQSPGNPLGLAFQVNGYGLTMGQLLTIPMILVGLWFIARAKRAEP